MKPAQLKLQPITIALLEALERLELPILAMVGDIAEAAVKHPSQICAAADYKFQNFTLDQVLITIWCFLTPIDLVENEIEKGKYRAIECARNSIQAKYHSEELPIIFSSIGANITSVLAEVGHRLKDPGAYDFSI